MKIRTPLSVYSATFLASLGLAPLTACGGSVSGEAVGGAGNGGMGGKGGAVGGVAGYTITDGGSPGMDAPCRNPTPLLGPNGEPTGYVNCDGGTVHRTERMDCPSAIPRQTPCQAGTYFYDSGIPVCTLDSDCTAAANGYCSDSPRSINEPPVCHCVYGCVRDSDCEPGQICLCGDPTGRCVPSSCSSDQDCGQALCLSYEAAPGCSYPPALAFACESLSDTCVSNVDCSSAGTILGSSNMYCSLVNGARACVPAQCAISGRPFVVQGEARVASTVCRSDWSSAATPDVSGLSRSERASLSLRWTEIALMEHASIAAFARFALDLLSLGAPPELLAATQDAMRDETLHARDAFALASAYADAPVGPGALAVDGSLGARSPLEVIRTTILEGCIGETVAAVEAAEALAHATDPAVREVLTQVAHDEARHAELAWRFVKWALLEGPQSLRGAAAVELKRLVRAEMAASTNSSRVGAWGHDRESSTLGAHGILEGSLRAEIHRRVLVEVIEPCACALEVAASHAGPSVGSASA